MANYEIQFSEQFEKGRLKFYLLNIHNNCFAICLFYQKSEHFSLLLTYFRYLSIRLWMVVHNTSKLTVIFLVSLSRCSCYPTKVVNAYFPESNNDLNYIISPNSIMNHFLHHIPTRKSMIQPNPQTIEPNLVSKLINK